MESSPLTAETVAGERSQGKGVCAGLPLLTFGFYLVLLQSLPPGQGFAAGLITFVFPALSSFQDSELLQINPLPGSPSPNSPPLADL